MWVFVDRPDKDTGAVRELCLVQSFMHQRSFAGTARGDHGDYPVRRDGGLKPVLQFLEPRRAAAKMLRGLQRVTEERLPDTGSGNHTISSLRDEVGKRGRNEPG